MISKEKIEEYIDLASYAINCEPKSFWLWVTGPDYYLDHDGSDREILEPGYELNWTCDENTRIGDLIILYRTSPKTDVKYLVQAISKPYINKDSGKFSGWHYCDAIVIYKFENSVLSKEMKQDAILADSEPVRRNYQGNQGSFVFNNMEWMELNLILQEKNPEYNNFLEALIAKNPSLKTVFPSE
ncbi:MULTISPECIES: hypothetical protein [Methanobacterium]|uniref:Uncharacterized protein n=1 Tax=Methanobacterium veterum TaxID=408577 RepID=A0A9E4ZZR6_9EURY|nr:MULTISPECIES: hypothetical protein [Methanobacterium]MCZ3366533.1 hypothetical protein [Methanobacterium veterum]MCZ3371758.1 hypothetical protein [Methanobacterium veterum]